MKGSYTSLGLFLGLLCCWALGGCVKTLDLPGVKGERKIVLLGEMIAGDSVYIRGGQSVPVASGSDMTFNLPVGLTLTLDDGSGQVSLLGAADTLSPTLHTLLFTSSRYLKSGDTYNVSAAYPGLPVATVKVTIPEPISVSLQDTATVIYNTDTVLRFRINIKDNGATDNFYVIECLKQYVDVVFTFYHNGEWLSVSENRELYDWLKAGGTVVERSDTTYYRRFMRKPVYTNDNNSENAYVTGLTAQQSRVLLSDRMFNGQDYSTDVYVYMNPQADSTRGLTTLYVKSVTADYFRFLKSYQQADGASAFISLDAPGKTETNVNNGGGVIGGVSQVRYSYLLDSWEK